MHIPAKERNNEEAEWTTKVNDQFSCHAKSNLRNKMLKFWNPDIYIHFVVKVYNGDYTHTQ